MKATPWRTHTDAVCRPSLSGHLRISRVDHWFKNVFVLPGVVVAISMGLQPVTSSLAVRLLIGLASVCLVASSNYVINEVMDAPFDLEHPLKRNRPVPSGQVNIPLAYVQWIVLMLMGIGLALLVSGRFTLIMVWLWIMGCVYNLPPSRSKDLPYIDVASEAINNPLRMLAGWFVVTDGPLAPASLTVSYWMIGCYFMAIKRFAEYRHIGNHIQAAAYRKSFAFYTEQRLLVSIMFYGSAAMLFFGAFTVRYRLELIVAFPLVALAMAVYLSLSFKKDSPVQQPEKLYRERLLMIVVAACAILMGVLLFLDLPIVYRIFTPTVPTRGQTMPPTYFGSLP